VERISLGQVLTAMPHVSPEAWRSASLSVRWLVSARASVLVMTIGAAVLGGMLAASSREWDPLAWTVCLLGLVLAHASNNQLNDLTDTVRGIDEGNYFRIRYGAHVLQDGLLSRGALCTYLGVTGGVACLLGLWLIARTGPELWIPFLLGSLILLFYTWPLKQWGGGELAVLLVWGPLMVGGTWLAATGVWHWESLLIGSVYGLGPTMVIFGKHIDKLEFDRNKGVGTLPVRLGHTRSRLAVQLMMVAQYLGCALVVVLGWLPPTILLVVFALPKAFRMGGCFSRGAPDRCPEGFPERTWPLWYAAFAFDHTRLFSSLLLAGFCLDLILNLQVTISR